MLRRLAWIISLVGLFGLLFGRFNLIHAQTSIQSGFNFGFALPFSDSEIVPGDIIAQNQNGELIRSTIHADESIYGVYSPDITIVYSPAGEETPIAIAGEARVNVTTLGGPIVVGDRITSSSIPGKGQKVSSDGGWIVGYALTPFGENDGGQMTFEEREIRQGTIAVRLAIGPGRVQPAGYFSNMIDQIGFLLLRNVETPERSEKLFRFIIAAIITLVTLIICFVTFGRSITRGIEAIGRNPLAKSQIQAMIVINVVLFALVSLGGIILSLAIIRY